MKTILMFKIERCKQPSGNLLYRRLTKKSILRYSGIVRSTGKLHRLVLWMFAR